MVTFTPQPTIQSRRQLGQALLGKALNPQANVSSLAPFASLAQGLTGGFLGGRANVAEQGNQDIRQQTLAQARDAALAGNDIGAILSGSQDPEQQRLGLGLIGQERAQRAKQSNLDRAFKETKRLNDARIAKLGREARATANAGGFKTQQDKAKFTQGLRKEIAQRSDEFIKVRDAFSKVNASNNDAAGDLALIFNFMKMLDPGSVVREGEFATAQNAAGAPERVVNLYNRLLTGERLNATQRERFKAQAGSIFQSSNSSQKRLIDSFGGIADRLGIGREDVFTDLSPQQNSAEIPTVTTPEEAGQLPPGTKFKDPQGNIRVVPGG